MLHAASVFRPASDGGMVRTGPCCQKRTSGRSRTRGLVPIARLVSVLGVIIVAGCIGVASADASVDSAAAQSGSIMLPAGHGEYFYVGSTSGEQPVELISWLEGQNLAVSARGSGDQAISIGHSTADSGSYSTMAAAAAILGVGIDGYEVVQTFSGEAAKAGHHATRHPEKAIKGASLTLKFATTEADQLVLILVGGQSTGTLALSGIDATSLQNATYGTPASDVLASAAAYTAQLPVGRHKAKWRSETYAPNAGTSLGAVVYVLAPAPAPVVTSIAPSSGSEAGGTAVTITGTNLDGATAVDFGATSAASFKVDSPTTIEAVSPSGSGVADVTVTTERGTSATSSGDQFRYMPPPAVTSVSPNNGPQTGGTAVTITGQDFSGTTAVNFGATGASSFKVASPTTIEAVSPSGSGGVDVTVSTPYGTSATSPADQFNYVPPPSVTGVSPNNGPEGGGTAVTISGNNLSGVTSVRFGSANAQSFKVNSPTSIEAVSPGGRGTVDVTVSGPYGTSTANSGDHFTYNLPPESIQIGWSSTHPTWIWMTLTGFAPGSYPYWCDFGSGGDQEFTLYESVTPETRDNGKTCYDTIRGDTVWVTIGSVRSNTIVVP